MIRIALTALSLLLPTLTVAAAQDRPRLVPDRDVTVTYRVLGDAAHIANAPAVSSVRASFSVQGERLRVEAPGQPAYMLLDRGARRMLLVMPAEHSFMDLPYDVSRALRFDEDDAHLTRRGRATVAGLSCTDYDVQTTHGRGTACLTDDGVMLRAQVATGDRNGGLEATAVSYAPQPSALFTPPAGFQRLEIPQLRLPSHALGPSGN